MSTDRQDKQFAAGNVTIEEFAAAIMEELSAADPNYTYHYDRASEAVRDQHERKLFDVRKAYDESRARYKDARILARTIPSLRVLVTYPFDDVADRLMPVVRSPTTIGDFKKVLSPEHLRLTEHLAVSLVVDLPESMANVGAGALAKWNVSFDDAYRRALANLEKSRLPALLRNSEGMYEPENVSDYNSSRILLPNGLHGLDLQGEPVVMLPASGTILVAGMNSMRALTFMLEDGPSYQYGTPISCIPILRHDTTWQSFSPHEDHPLFARAKELQAKSMRLWYANQHSFLLKRSQDFLAAFVSGEDVGLGGMGTLSMLQADMIPALLPKTDMVWFIHPNAIKNLAISKYYCTLGAHWARIQEVAPDLLQETDDYPPRYRVTRFPTRQELTAMCVGAPQLPEIPQG